MGNSYKDSKFRNVYELIADETDNTPEHVYDLAHGAHVKNHEDNIILDLLEKHKVIKVHKSKHKKSSTSNHPHSIMTSKRKEIFIKILMALALAVALFFIFASVIEDSKKPAKATIYEVPQHD